MSRARTPEQDGIETGKRAQGRASAIKLATDLPQSARRALKSMVFEALNQRFRHWSSSLTAAIVTVIGWWLHSPSACLRAAVSTFQRLSPIGPPHANRAAVAAAGRRSLTLRAIVSPLTLCACVLAADYVEHAPKSPKTKQAERHQPSPATPLTSTAASRTRAACSACAEPG